MGLNIKNERVHELAKRAARVTGKSQTGVIEEALERLLAGYGHDPADDRARAKIELVHAIVLNYAQAPTDKGRQLTCIEDLYDASGLPR